MERLANFTSNDDFRNDNDREPPSLYVACLAAYNAGIHHGTWINATQECEDIQEAIEQMLDESPIRDAEEWEIHDHNFGCDIRPSEDLETLHQKALFISEYGELGIKMLDDLYEVEEAREILEDFYQGEYASEIDFAHHLFNERSTGVIPEHLKAYIDYRTFSSDLFISDYRSLALGNSVHIFSHSQCRS